MEERQEDDCRRAMLAAGAGAVEGVARGALDMDRGHDSGLAGCANLRPEVARE